MKKFTECRSHAAVLARNNVDTDLIIRIERMSQLKRGQFAEWAFESLRYRADGSENPDFVLNQAPFRDVRILISGVNFGCGSSREMAVWALEDFGIRCVIAQSFGDIFYNNCLQNGVLPVILPAESLAALSALAAAGAIVNVDLENCAIGVDNHVPFSFSLPEEQRQALLLGLDDVDQAVAMEDAIRAFQAKDRLARPWIYATAI
ncbi:3-isopropylmalate dehydratase small subunit [Paraburkholderia antibiotica]|uniref:3-isopropylmalate dehydratase n=1 Tax=Paraburkholderia antibiotica TaxID=2728839 RepID=A0A7X9X2W6_9BURK|nr:3-isopropylmalate dehydratase small subunit [Paraburkholderia antibiotica]NML30376.1 3-isopropylmalate dehydratase small subunit [Paraburkholderia antibiotica]